MKTYSLVGLDPTMITHKGTINGKLPKKTVSSKLVLVEPTVTAGKAVFENLEEGGLFAFDKKTVVIESLIGTATIVTAASNGQDAGRTIPTTFPFTLLPGEWLKFTSGSEVGCICRLEGTRIY